MDKIENMRKGNIEFRYSEANKQYEIVQWIENPTFGKRDDFEPCKDAPGMFRPKGDSCYKVTESSFRTPEYCIVIASFKDCHDEEPDLMTCGTRPIRLRSEDRRQWKNFLDCVEYGFNEFEKMRRNDDEEDDYYD